MEFELETRKKIFDVIRRSPGIHLRELERSADIVLGNLQYHLHYLEKNRIITSLREGHHVRYFVQDKALDADDMNILSFLRTKACRHILIKLLEVPDMNNKELSSVIRLSPSTVSWHMNKLIAANIVSKKKNGRISKYEIVDPPRTVQLLISYKGSFLDRLVDNFIEMWEFDNNEDRKEIKS